MTSAQTLTSWCRPGPARLIRTRYEDGDIARLLAVAWWDWPVERVTEHMRAIMSGSIADLEAAAAGPWRYRPPAGRVRVGGVNFLQLYG